MRGMGGLQPHPEHEDENDPNIGEKVIPEIPQQRTPRPINPSLQTLEKAVAAKIYFENLYFPLFRHPPSREQRRVAMERDMDAMGLSEVRKVELRRRWLQNETDYLRERRRKVDVSAFVKLKTIGHGTLLTLKAPLTGHQTKSEVNFDLRCIWGGILSQRANFRSTFCNEAS